MSEVAMRAEETKAVVVRFNEAMREFWRTGDDGLFDGLLAPGYVQHWPGFPADREGYLLRLRDFRTAFPDLMKTTEDLLADGDKVIDRVTVRATHAGEFLGLAPSGKAIEMTEMHVARVSNGQIVERWGEWDLLGLLRQVGALSQQIDL
jgi:predicted ester cyclase